MGRLFVAAQIQEAVTITYQRFPVVLEQRLQLRHILDDDADADFAASHRRQQLFKIIRQSDVGKLVQYEMHMHGKPAVMLSVRREIELLEHLGVEHADQVVEGTVVVRNAAVDDGFLLSDGGNVHFVHVGHAHHIRKVEGGQTDANGNQNGFRSLAGSHLEDAILLHSNVIRIAHGEVLKQIIQIALEILLFLAHLRCLKHLHDHAEVAFLFGGFMDEIQTQRLKQRRFGLLPERIIGVGILRRGIADQGRHQAQHIVIRSYVLQGIVAEGVVHVDQVDHLHIIAQLLHEIAGIPRQFSFWICNHKRSVSLKDVGFGIKARLACAGTADHQHIEVAPVLVAVQSQTEILRHQQIRGRFLRGIFLRDLLDVSPLRRAVLLQRTGAAAGNGPCHDTGGIKANEQKQVFGRRFYPLNVEGLRHGSVQAIQYAHEVYILGHDGCEDQRKPCHRQHQNTQDDQGSLVQLSHRLGHHLSSPRLLRRFSFLVGASMALSSTSSIRSVVRPSASTSFLYSLRAFSTTPCS